MRLEGILDKAVPGGGRNRAELGWARVKFGTVIPYGPTSEHLQPVWPYRFAATI